MSFESLLIHTIEVHRIFATTPAAEDDWNIPATNPEVEVFETRGRVWDTAGRQLPDAAGSGPVITDALCFLPGSIPAIGEADVIHNATTGKIYEILHVRPSYGAVGLHHYEVDCVHVRTPVAVAAP